MNRRTLVILLSVLILLAVASSWLSFESSEKQRRQRQAASQSQDYYLQQAEITTLNASGQAEQQLSSAFIAHYPEQQVMKLQEAELRLMSAPDRVWKLQAREAKVDLSDNSLYLQQQVQLQQLNAENLSTLQLNTERLTLHPESGFIETDAPLQLKHAQGSLHATGLHAYLDQDRIELLSEVKLRYEP